MAGCPRCQSREAAACGRWLSARAPPAAARLLRFAAKLEERYPLSPPPGRGPKTAPSASACPGSHASGRLPRVWVAAPPLPASTVSIERSPFPPLPSPPNPQPKEIKDIKEFLLKARRKDAKSVRVKKATRGGREGATKFKVRCARYLYTLVVADAEKAAKLKQSLPPGLQVLTDDK